MEFESLPTTPTADELLDRAFSRAARSGRAKHGVEAQDSMLQIAANVLSDNLEHVVRSWPDFDELDPFYRELADAIVGVDALRSSLSEVGWAGRKTAEIGREYRGRVRGVDADTARKLRKQAFARMADVVEEVSDDLATVADAREALRGLPTISPDEPTIVVAGAPNVGKSSFVNAVTRASNAVAEYPFTTTAVHVGHVERRHIRYQLVDTPGLLDRPEAERNAIERQAASALEHTADAVLVFLDPSETCGYPLTEQQTLEAEIDATFEVPVIAVANKADLSTDIEADFYVSVTDDEAVAGRQSADTGVTVSSLDELLTATIEAIDYEPELPIDDR